MITPTEKTGILLETMPWLRKYSGETVVIKYGGNAMINRELQEAFATDILFLHQWGVHPIVVHGGGPQINSMLQRVGLKAPFTHGLRVTTPEVMEIVRMVLIGKVQRELISLLNVGDYQAVGLAGEDAGLMQARKRPAIVEGQNVDLGLVGQITHIDPKPLRSMIESGYIPVVSSIATDQDDPTSVLNVNADEVAGELAAAVGAAKLVMLTDVEGLYGRWPDKSSLLTKLSAEELRELLPTVQSGMIPKVQAALAALDGGVPQVHIIDGRVQHSMLVEIFTNDGIGTMITQEQPEVFQ